MAGHQKPLVFISGDMEVEDLDQLYVGDIVCLVHNQIDFNLTFEGWFHQLSEKGSDNDT